MVHCSSVQQASSYYPPQTQTALGKGTDFRSAQSLAHLQQLILRQRAQHCTLCNADSLTFACQPNQLLMGQRAQFKRGIKKGAADSGCLIPHFVLLCFWLFDARSNSLIVLTNPNPRASLMPVWPTASRLCGYSLVAEHVDLRSTVLAARFPFLTRNGPRLAATGD